MDIRCPKCRSNYIEGLEFYEDDLSDPDCYCKCRECGQEFFIFYKPHKIIKREDVK